MAGRPTKCDRRPALNDYADRTATQAYCVRLIQITDASNRRSTVVDALGADAVAARCYKAAALLRHWGNAPTRCRCFANQRRNRNWGR